MLLKNKTEIVIKNSDTFLKILAQYNIWVLNREGVILDCGIDKPRWDNDIMFEGDNFGSYVYYVLKVDLDCILSKYSDTYKPLLLKINSHRSFDSFIKIVSYDRLVNLYSTDWNFYEIDSKDYDKISHIKNIRVVKKYPNGFTRYKK